MAVPAQVVPEVAPQGASPNRYQSISSEPANPGPGIGGGLIALGTGAQQMGEFFGQAAADDAYNQFEEGTNKIMFGEPGKMVPGPDGKPVPDTGYMGLKGRAALDAREGTVKALDGLRDTVKGHLTTLKQDSSFDRISRRYKAIIDGQIGTHARTQGNVYASNVNSASAKLAMDEIAANPNDEAKLSEGLDKLVRARVRQAELQGGGPELILEAERSARRDGMSAHIQSIAVEDPARALRMIERNKPMLGVNYDNLYNSVRSKADQQIGREEANRLIGAGTSLKDGADTMGVIRHFEGFRNTAYWDVNHWRTGYGSDTVTRDDGRVEKVTENTVVSREDAERDLVRRTELSQQSVRKAIGAEAWEKLDPRAKASLTSIDYNYGKLPPQVAAAARTGDPEAIANSILTLTGHNKGINARRRAIEAANVRGQVGPEGRDSLPDQAMILDEINNSHLTPEAKAAAVSEASRAYAASHNAQVKNRTAFESQVNDSAAEAMQTGAETSPIPETRFMQQYGPTTGPVKYQEYRNQVQFGADRKSFETLSEQGIQNVIDARIPAPAEGGTYPPGYANQMKQVERLREYAKALSKQRSEDPAGAVSRWPSVGEALKLYDPKRPESFAPVALARKNAQDALGIDPEYQAVITKAEGLKLTEPLMRVLPGEQKQVLEQMGQTFRKMFGDDASSAMAYALRARKLNVQTAQVASKIVDKLAIGEGISVEDAAELDTAREVDAAQKAAWGPTGNEGDRNVVDRGPNFSGRPRPPLRVIGNPESDTGFEGSPVINTTPPVRAVQALLASPDRLSAFREEYGEKAAEDVVKKFPVIFKKAGGGG
jgi:GH24 family phage-related lysozyme (muramidase)